MTRKKKDPRVGTGKKPKGSGRRLYTDENPKDTVSIKFATPKDARATVAKVKRINKPFARKIQILTVLEQRAKVAGKTEQAAIAKRGKEAIRRKRKEKSDGIRIARQHAAICTPTASQRLSRRMKLLSWSNEEEVRKKKRNMI